MEFDSIVRNISRVIGAAQIFSVLDECSKNISNNYPSYWLLPVVSTTKNKMTWIEKRETSTDNFEIVFLTVDS
jgi:hypothetical protein